MCKEFSVWILQWKWMAVDIHVGNLWVNAAAKGKNFHCVFCQNLKCKWKYWFVIKNHLFKSDRQLISNPWVKISIAAGLDNFKKLLLDYINNHKRTALGQVTFRWKCPKLQVHSRGNGGREEIYKKLKYIYQI